MARYIPPPREDFIDPRTGKIAVSWFRYLLKEAGNVDDVQLQAALNSVYGVAAAAEAEKKANEATLLASIQTPQQDFTPEIDAVRLAQLRVEIGEIEKRIDDAMLRIAMPQAPSVSDHADLTGLAADGHPQYLRHDGTRALTADWDAGSFEIRAQTFESDVTTGTAPLVIASTTKVTNLNADLLDDQTGSYYLDSANFTGTNWTDLTDGGTTTLHTHTSGVASSITVADEATDTSCYLLFATAATGDLGPKSNANLTLDSATGIVTFASTVLTTTDINGGTIDGTTQASGTINGPIAAGGTWTAAATWTLPAWTAGGNVSLGANSISRAGTAAGLSLDASNNATLSGTLAVNGASITTDDTTFACFNTNATTVNAFGAATTLRIGGANGNIGFGSSAVGYYGARFAGTITSSGASTVGIGLGVDYAIVGAAGDTSYLTAVSIVPTVATQGNSDTIGQVATLRLSEPNITVNTGDIITVASTLYINSAPTEGATNAGLYQTTGSTYLLGTTINMITSGTTLTVGTGADNGTVSAGIFTDRTKHFDGDAIAELRKIRGKSGHIDHATLPAFAAAQVKKEIHEEVHTKDEKGNPIMLLKKTGEFFETERDLGAMISLLTVGMQQLVDRVEAVEVRGH